MEFFNARNPKERLPEGCVQVSVVYKHLERAYENGFFVISEQGGTRSSKTVTTMIWVCIKALESEIKVGILRKTYPILRMTVLQDFIGVMTQLGLYDEDQFNKTEHVYYFSNGSEFWFIAVDESEKIKGFTSDIMWLNEATEFAVDDYHQLNFRCKKFMVLDYNPNYEEKHWLVKEVNEENICEDYTGMERSKIEKEHKRAYFFITTYVDNPFLSLRQRMEIESLKTKNYTLWQQFGQGRRCLLTGRVFTNIRRVETLTVDKKAKWYVGIDYGYSNKPTAIVKVGLNAKRCYIEEIAYKVDLRTSEIREILLKDKRVRGLTVIADSANELMNAEVEGERGNKKIDIKRVNKGGSRGQTKRLDAIRTMQQYEFTITDDSVNVCNEFDSYVFKTEKDGSVSNKPVEFNDHAIDATRYVIMERGIKGVRKGVIMS